MCIRDRDNIDYYELDENTRSVVQGSRKIVPDLKNLLKKDGQTVEKITLLFKTMEERERVKKALGEIKDIQFASSLPKNVEISQKAVSSTHLDVYKRQSSMKFLTNITDTINQVRFYKAVDIFIFTCNLNGTSLDVI